MANLIIAIIIFTVVFLIAIQSISIRILYNGTATVEFDFWPFALVLHSKKRKEKAKKSINFVRKLKISFAKAAAVKRTLDFLLRHSKLSIREISIPINADTPSKHVLYTQNITSAILTIITYLSLKSEALSTDDFAFVISKNTDNKKAELDLTLNTTLYIAVFSLYVYFIGTIKQISRKEDQFVRNKNE